MDKNLPNLDKLIREEINSIKGSSDLNIWKEIEKQLDQDDANYYKKRFDKLQRWSIWLLLLFLGFAGGTIVYYKSTNDNSQTGENSIANKKHQTDKELSARLNTTQNNSTHLSIKKILRKQNEITHGDSSNGLQSRLVEKNIHGNKVTSFTEPLQLKTNGSIGNSNQGRLQNRNDKSLQHNYPLTTSLRHVLRPKETMNWNLEIININDRKAADISAALRISLQQHSKDILSNNEMAQVTTKQSEKKIFQNSGRFFLNAYFAPEFTGYNLENDEMNQYDSKEKIRGREKNEFSFSSGISLGYQIKKHWSVESGISFSSLDISIDESKIFAERNSNGDIKFRYNTSSGYTYFLPSFNRSPMVGDSLSTSSSHLLLQYLGFPLSLNYTMEKGKVKLGMGAGIMVNFLKRSLVQTEVENQQHAETTTITQLVGLRKVHTSLLISPEVDYTISKNWSINARPYFKYSLIPVNKENIVKTYAYNLGLAAGLTYRF